MKKFQVFGTLATVDISFRWVPKLLPELRILIKTTEELYKNQTMAEMDIIFSCYESRNFEFPKKYFFPNQPSPMMKLYHKKLVDVRTVLSSWPHRNYFLLYITIVFDSFKRVFSIYQVKYILFIEETNLLKIIKVTF